MRWLLVSAALLAIPCFPKDFTERQEFTYPLAENGRVFLKNEVGEVRLRASDRKDVHIVALKRARDSDQRDGPQRVAELRVQVSAASGEVRILGRWPERDLTRMLRGKSKLQIDFEIEAPRTARLELENDVGEVRVEGAAHDVIVRESVGEVSIALADSFLPRRVYLRTRIGDVDTNLDGRGRMQGWLGKKFTAILDGNRTLDVRVGIGDIRVTARKVPVQV